MSAIRHNSTRRDARHVTSSPYSRPGARKSAWSLRGFFGFLNPLRLASTEDDEQVRSPIEPMEGMDEGKDSSVDLQDDDFEEPEHQEVEVAPQPIVVSPSSGGESAPAMSPSVEENTTPARNLQTVSAFLAEKGNKPLNRVELAGLVSLLQGSVADEEPSEPFRFSSSPRATTPAFSFLPPSASAPAFPSMASTTQPPRKTLSKNPNGVYRWQGGGSARPRNRYQSPAFGTSRSMPSRMKINPDKPTTTKRRRTEEEPKPPSPSQSSAQTSLPPVQESTTSKPSAPRANGLPPASASASASTSRSAGNGPAVPLLRTSNLPPKASAPVVPSPLRQTWGQTDSPSPPHAAPAPKPTRAANIMTEIIKEAAPRPKPDFLNPYQDASPVPLKPSTKKVLPRKPRAARVKVAPVEPKVVELSPQKIIEATVPKGSKRLRPPPDLDNDTETRSHPESNFFSPPRRTARSKSPEPHRTNGINGGSPSATTTPRKSYAVTIEEVSDEDSPSPPKKQRPAPPAAPKLSAGPRPPPVVIEEVDDVDMSRTDSAKVERPSQVVEPEESETRQRSTSPSAPPLGTLPNGNAAARSAFGLKSSAPKAPSKLRYSFQADKEEKDIELGKEKERLQAQGAPSVPAVPKLPTPTPPKATPSSTTSKPVAKTKEEVRSIVASTPIAELPSYTFEIPTSSPGAGPGPSSQKARDAALAVSKASLPTFDFSAPPPPVAPVKPAPVAFNFSAAGMKALTQAPGGTWTCSMCMLNNPASATEQCTICEAPRASKPAPTAAPNPPPAPTVKAFDWGAAGLKKPEAPSTSSTWTCSTCMLTNPASATAKCAVCDAPR